jgi:DNA-binding NtrC family response regulator
VRTSVRLIAATNRDLPSLIRSKDFRDDLYFRLNVFQITVPPLRVRGDDVVLLARFFLNRSASALRKGQIQLTPAAEEILLAYEWPGNIRELKNVMERAAILCDTDEVGAEHLPREPQGSAFLRNTVGKDSDVLLSLNELERHYILHVMKTVNGNLSEAARILGVARNTLKAKLRLPEES